MTIFSGVRAVCALLLAGTSFALWAQAPLFSTRVIVEGELTAAACRVEINGRPGEARITFPEYHKGLRNLIAPQEIQIRLFDDGATVQGCSAFRAGNLVRMNFGNPGQLDERGVVTTGAGDRVRIHVSALDEEASHRNIITDSGGRDQVTWPAAFAARGLLRFQAVPSGLEDAQAGEYTGQLSFVLTYE